MPGVVGTESLPAELSLGVAAVLVLDAAAAVVAATVPGVEPALGVEAVGAADQQRGGGGGGKHADVVLALVLKMYRVLPLGTIK